MPTYVSILGKHYPAQERIALKNTSNEPFEYDGKMIQPGEEFIYEGPDRAAVKELAKEDKEFLGQDFRDDNDFLDYLHNSRFKGDMGAYFKAIRFDEEAEMKKLDEKKKSIKSHAPLNVSEERLIEGGGKDTSGNSQNSVIGGFGDERIRPQSELQTKKKLKPAK